MAARERAVIVSGGQGTLRAWVLVALSAVGLGGCTAMDDAFAMVPFLNTMRWSPSFDPYENPRPAPPGSVPFESPGGAVAHPRVEPTEAALNAFATRLSNPIPGDTATVELGRTMYERHCAVCHGVQGDGRGPLVGPGRFPFAPDLRLPVSVERSDAFLYAITYAGRGLMPAYGAQTSHMDRWYIVNYVRSLQQQPAAAPDGAAPGAQQGTE